MESPSTRKTYKNKVLASLPASEIERLAPHLTPRIFKRDQILFNPGQKVEHVYFLEEGICSIVITMENGSSIEVGIIGRDGFVGLPAVLGTGHSLGKSFIQLPGSGYSIEAKIVTEHMQNGLNKLRAGLERGVQALLTQTSQTAACNRVHELEERLARWLLMCQERIQLDSLPITHEFLAMMLGTNRSSVTVAAGVLSKAGFIDYSRGHVQITDRKGLEQAACECQAVVHDEYVRLGLL